MMLLRNQTAAINAFLGANYIPEGVWAAIGSIFMFRMIIYMHDLRHMKQLPGLREYLAYFFLLPNYYFPLFPVIDYQVMRMSYYRRDIHEVAQQGIAWIGRGTVQLILYRVLSYYKGLQSIERIDSPASLFLFMVLTYVVYLRVSGQFHIIVGMLHLFGYDLPETNRKYFLARSLTDFWRRINIYWKDFMVKIVYFPIYFRLRKGNELRAKLLATGAVFFVTWLLHGYQTYWLNGIFQVGPADTVFWAALGGLMALTIWFEHRHQKRGGAAWARHLQTAASTVATFVTISVLWSMWSAPTLGAWTEAVSRGLH
jgi:D-alanyl-lipoteichoic acid acyltransferase DltB (MBOAT superfamily)